MTTIRALAWLSIVYGACALLTGCSKNINAVKESAAPTPQYKIGQLLDHKENCLNTKWSSSADDKGRPIVEYRCEVAIRPAVLEEFKRGYAERVNSDIKFRLATGMKVLVLHHTGEDDSLEETRLDLLNMPVRFANSRIRDDPASAAKLDELKVRYDAAVQTLERIDAPCKAELQKRMSDNEARIGQMLQDRSKLIEVIRWALQDDAIVDYSTTFMYADGTAANHSPIPGLLYPLMLNPQAAVSEERFLMDSTAAPAMEQADINYCGHPEAYKPVTDQLASIQMAEIDIGKDYQSRHLDQLGH